MQSAFVETLYRQASRHRRAFLLYLCVLSGSMSLAVSVSAIVPPRAPPNASACGGIGLAHCTVATASQKR